MATRLFLRVSLTVAATFRRKCITDPQNGVGPRPNATGTTGGSGGSEEALFPDAKYSE
jgi:hypothetical protein